MGDELEASYYGILPANVRYDKRLKPMSKIMYTEITCLSNKYGYCYAKNKYFADLYEVEKETVSRWISQLIKYGYVNSVSTYKEGTKEIDNRFLTIIPIPIDLDVMGGIDLKIKGGNDNKIKAPIDDKVKDNSTSCFNNININIGCVFCVWKKYPNGSGKVSSFKNIPKLIKKYKIVMVLVAVDRYIEHVKFQRDQGFEGLAYKNASTFFNSGIHDYLIDDYKSPVAKVVESKPRIELKTEDFNFKPKTTNDPELNKIKGVDIMDIIKKSKMN